MNESNERIQCCFCGILTTESNNAQPVKMDQCCNQCNMIIVIPTRILQWKTEKKVRNMIRFLGKIETKKHFRSKDLDPYTRQVVDSVLNERGAKR